MNNQTLTIPNIISAIIPAMKEAGFPTKNDIKRIATEVTIQASEDILAGIDRMFKERDLRFDNIDTRLAKIDTEISFIKKDVSDIKNDYIGEDEFGKLKQKVEYELASS